MRRGVVNERANVLLPDSSVFGWTRESESERQAIKVMNELVGPKSEIKRKKQCARHSCA